MSTVDRVKIISTGSFSPGCGGTTAGWDLPLMDDFKFFLGHRFTSTRVGLAPVVTLRQREVAATCCLEPLEVPLTAVLEHVVMLSLLSLQCLLPSRDSLDPPCKMSTRKQQGFKPINMQTKAYTTELQSSISHPKKFFLDANTIFSIFSYFYHQYISNYLVSSYLDKQLKYSWKDKSTQKISEGNSVTRVLNDCIYW